MCFQWGQIDHDGNNNAASFDGSKFAKILFLFFADKTIKKIFELESV